MGLYIALMSWQLLASYGQSALILDNQKIILTRRINLKATLRGKRRANFTPYQQLSTYNFLTVSVRAMGIFWIFTPYKFCIDSLLLYYIVFTAECLFQHEHWSIFIMVRTPAWSGLSQRGPSYTDLVCFIIRFRSEAEQMLYCGFLH